MMTESKSKSKRRIGSGLAVLLCLVFVCSSATARTPGGRSSGGSSSSSSRRTPSRTSGSSSRRTGSGSGSSRTGRSSRSSGSKVRAPAEESEDDFSMDIGMLDDNHNQYDDDDYDDDDAYNYSKDDESEDAYSHQDQDDYDQQEDEYDNDEYDAFQPQPRARSGARAGAGAKATKSRNSRNSRGSRDEPSRRGRSGSDSRNRGRSNRPSSSSRRRSSVVPYNNRRGRAQPQPSAFTRGITALRQSIPDPTTLKDTALSSISTAKQSTSKLTSNLYREIKGLTSSELEQVMLKATAPNDLPVKGKHVERLVGVTYQISGRYDIYDAVLRKLWSKMVENDWRTTVKALYILHRFSADGAPDHQAALKARLRELRRTRDPKRKEKYFNSKLLLAGENTTPATKHYRAFLSRYAHYVLLRAQCFGGVFTEIANDPNQIPTSKSKSNNNRNKKSSSSMTKKAITSTCLKNEHLEAAQMLLKAGLACELHSSKEECENTAIALERVVADLIGLTTAVASALTNALKNGGLYDNDTDMDWVLIQKWCQFYSTELLIETKGLIKRTTPSLDAYGLFLPSRMGTTLSQDLLQKGLKGRDFESSSSLSSSDAGTGTAAVVDEEEDKQVSDYDQEETQDQDKDMIGAGEDENEEVHNDDENNDGYEEEYEYEEYEYE